MMDDYFRAFEHRRPPEPLPYSRLREMLWQFLAVMTLVVGAWYIHWRWTSSLNPDAMWFAVALALAETCAFVGLVLFVYNLWQDQPVTLPDPPATVEQIDPDNPDPGRPIAVDVLFATYNEEPELVRLGILDAKAMDYPIRSTSTFMCWMTANAPRCAPWPKKRTWAILPATATRVSRQEICATRWSRPRAI